MHRRLRRWPARVAIAAALSVTATASSAPALHLPAALQTAPAAAAPAPAATPPAPQGADTAASHAAQQAARKAARKAARHAARKRARAAAHRRARKADRRTHKATRAARSRIGSPYVSGATGPRVFDCSGLTQWSMRRAGVDLPRTSFAQAQRGTHVRPHKIRRGDLVFFNSAGPGASHVAIAVDGRTVVSATSHGVRRHSIQDAYWGAHYVGARRVVHR
jgi:cell wall-associated NlpC family hydrolase